MLKILLGAILALASLTGCNGLKMGVGLKGEMLEDNMMILDGDTFTIQDRIGDSLFIAQDYAHPNSKKSYYLVRYEHNGLYYPQIGAKTISLIDNTTDFVCIDEKDIYDIQKGKVLFSAPCNALVFYYIDRWKDKFLFTNFDTICFSDGKCVGLQEYVWCRKAKKEGMLTLVNGAEKIDVTFSELYDADHLTAIAKDARVERLTRDYYIKPQNKDERAKAGFRVDVEIPKGNSQSDKAIRQWMMSAIKDDAFYQLPFHQNIPIVNSSTLDEMKGALDKYGVLWEKLFRAEYQMEDTLNIMTCDIKIKKVTDCDDYTTYHYWASLYDGGLHDLPRGYYIMSGRKILIAKSFTIS